MKLGRIERMAVIGWRGRCIPAVAPSATAFNTSVARLTPPSTNSWNFSFGKVIPRFSLNALTTSTSTSMPERAKSSCLPPWFERTAPAHPASYALKASSYLWTPLRINGTTSSQSDSELNEYFRTFYSSWCFWTMVYPSSSARDQ